MGINTWDTANMYSNGASEEIVGKALKKYDIPRHKVVIMTKCFWATSEDMRALPLMPISSRRPPFPRSLPPARLTRTPDLAQWKYKDSFARSKDYQNQSGLSRAAIFNQVDASLARLGTPYIDLLQIHRFDTTTPIQETMRALHDLVLSGKVRYIGASSMWATQFARMQHCAEINGWTKFTSMQGQYNLLYREEEREMIRFCNDTGVGLVPWAPLCRGHLARPPSDFGSTERSALESKNPGLTGTGEPDLSIIKRVQEIAEKRGWPMAHVALAWVNKRVASPIVGFSSIARMEEAAGARGKELTAEEESYLEELYQPKPIIGHT